MLKALISIMQLCSSSSFSENNNIFSNRIISIVALVSLSSIITCAQSTIIPIVELTNGRLLGGIRDGKWVASNLAADAMNDETYFKLVGADGPEKRPPIPATKAPTEDICPDLVRMELGLESRPGIAIGTMATWDITPRLPQKFAINKVIYKNAVSAFLKKKGIANPTVNISEVVSIDLDGDNVEEILITATRFARGISAATSRGDYSFVMVRRATGKTVTDSLVAGEFIRNRAESGVANSYGVTAIADLNGDGLMEILINTKYYEGEGASLFELKNGKLNAVKELTIECGL